MILNNIKSKLYKPELPKSTKIYHVQFSNKGIELTNLLLIFSNDDVTSSINSSVAFLHTTVVY